jgi:hypothetical protein
MQVDPFTSNNNPNSKVNPQSSNDRNSLQYVELHNLTQKNNINLNNENNNG